MKAEDVGSRKERVRRSEGGEDRRERRKRRLWCVVVVDVCDHERDKQNASSRLTQYVVSLSNTAHNLMRTSHIPQPY